MILPISFLRATTVRRVHLLLTYVQPSTWWHAQVYKNHPNVTPKALDLLDKLLTMGKCILLSTSMFILWVSFVVLTPCEAGLDASMP
jgi:phosphoserine phosphatase